MPLKNSTLTLKVISAALSVVLFATNVAFANAPERLFWTERQNVLRQRGTDDKNTRFVELPSLNEVESLPRSFFNSSPSVLKNQPLLTPQTNLTLRQIWQALSPNLGSLRHLTFAKQSQAPIVIHIQDVHRNTEPQKNITHPLQNLT